MERMEVSKEELNRRRENEETKKTVGEILEKLEREREKGKSKENCRVKI